MKLRLTNLAIAAAFLVLATGLCRAETDLEAIKKNVPKLLGANNQGMEFVLGFFPAWVEERPLEENYVPGIRLYISSAVTANVTISVPSKNWHKSIVTIPNAVDEVYIPREIAQCSNKTKDREPPDSSQVYPGGAVIVSADAPIICYGLIRYPFTSDGYLAAPIASLGNEYVIASYNGPTYDPDDASQFLTSYTAIVGAYNNTSVEFTYGGRASGWVPVKGGPSLKTGESMTKTLNKGDVWLVPARGNKPDITGSYVKATKPVACFSGNFCSYIPVDRGYCDVIIEQDLPMHIWGTKYYVTPIHGRLNNSPVRIFVSQNNTTVYRNGWTEQVCTIPNKYGSENEGWVEMRAAEGTPQAVTMLADKRFNVVQYNAGQEDDHVPSDPFEMTLTPIEQFQDHIMFNTPGIKSGLKFKKNYVNIVYRSTVGGYIPDDLEIGIFDELGELTWTPISMKYDGNPGFEFIDPTNPTPERKYFCKQLILPNDGVYHIRAKDKFAAYAYGFSDWDSYGFPTSYATFDFGKYDNFKPEINFTIDKNGNVPDASYGGAKPAYVKDMPENEAGRTNIGVVYFDKENSFNYSFSCEPYIAGNSASTQWSLKPADPTKDARAVITFTDRAGNDTTVVIEHKANLDAPELNTYKLGKVVPNPVGESGGTIEFETAYDGKVDLSLYNSASQLSAVLVNGYLKAGKHSIRIPIETLSSGSYTYRLSAGSFSSVQNLIIAK